MKFYYISQHENMRGEKEIHTGDCTHIATITRKTDLGYFPDRDAALIAAKYHHEDVTGCALCCPAAAVHQASAAAGYK